MFVAITKHCVVSFKGPVVFWFVPENLCSESLVARPLSECVL